MSIAHAVSTRHHRHHRRHFIYQEHKYINQVIEEQLYSRCEKAEIQRIDDTGVIGLSLSSDHLGFGRPM